MRIAGATALLLVALGTAAGTTEVRQVKNRPVSKVVTLLKDMVAQLQKEAEEDEEVYETMGCWCETNDREKTQAIADAEERIASLQAAIEELTGESSRLTTEIANLDREVQKNQEALDAATALRQKQLAEFTEEEKDMMQSIASLKSAVQVLSKHNSALLQVSDDEAERVIVTARDVLRRHTDAMSMRQRRVLEAFVQKPDSLFDTAPTMAQVKAHTKLHYAPQSGEVFGIMQQMKESFETNLGSSQKEEKENVAAYNDLKTAKETEIAAGQDQSEAKTAELASADEKRAQSKQDLEDTQEALASDNNFLADLKERCANTDAEYEERVKSRNLEITAVSKALEFLSSDEAQDLFARSLSSPSFVQRMSKEEAGRRVAIEKFLRASAQKFHNPKFSAIAAKVRMDAFGAVKETIQGMVDSLLKEGEDDVQKKDFCVDAFNANERETTNKEQEKANLIAKVEDLTMTMDTLAKAIAELKAEVTELQVQMKKAGENREKANKEFQATVADQRATQKLLTAAQNVLQDFYNKAAAFPQTHAKAHKAGQAPPPGFKSYEKSSTSGGVMAMIQQIIDDAKAMEAEAIQSEEDAQNTYQNFVKDTNTAIDEATKDIAHKTGQHAKAEEEKVETEVTRDEVIANLEQLNQQSLDTHRNCDFLMKNFQVRAQARDEEIEALKQSIAMFSGASFNALMQNWVAES